MSEHILVIEDDIKIAQLIASELSLEGYQVTLSHNGMDGLKMARENQFNLIILDWMLPQISGLDICLRLRNTGIKTPIIMLTAKDEIPDRVLGLNAGADDYVIKPFSIEELLARVKARIRSFSSDRNLDILIFEDLKLNRITREVYRGEQLIELTAKEFDLLEYFLKHPRQVLNRNQIIENVWGYDFIGESNIIEVYIRALRLKLEINNSPRLINTIRGVGYVLKN
jgi:DNA-binding response OmpR family regulator